MASACVFLDKHLKHLERGLKGPLPITKGAIQSILGGSLAGLCKLRGLRLHPKPRSSET